MRPLTLSTNKHFIPLANKPLLYYAIETVVEAGIKEIAINYNHDQLEELRTYVGNGQRWGVKFQFILQEKPLGLANIIQVSQDFVGQDPFLMHLGDNIFCEEISFLVKYFLENKPNGLVTILHHPENWRLGVPCFDKKGRLVKYLEKPKKPPNDYAIPGLYFFDKNVFRCFSGKDKIKPSARGELEISSLYQWLIDHGYRVETREFKGAWKDPGKFDDWLDANQFLLDNYLEPGSQTRLRKDVRVEGRVKIGKDCLIKNSLLRGPAVIGDRVVIEDSFIGPFSSVDNECQLVNAKIENTILMNGAQVKNLEKSLDSSLVGKESIIEGNHRLGKTIELFIGNLCQVRL